MGTNKHAHRLRPPRIKPTCTNKTNKQTNKHAHRSQPPRLTSTRTHNALAAAKAMRKILLPPNSKKKILEFVLFCNHDHYTNDNFYPIALPTTSLYHTRIEIIMSKIHKRHRTISV